jgi:hypothetical protein
MKKMKKIIVILAAVMLLVFLCFLPSLLACEHKNISSVDASLATCTKNGIKNEVCNDCGIVLNQSVIDAYGHSFGEYVLTRDPILGNKGVEMRTCNNCGFFEYKGFDCSHGSFKERVLVAPTCSEEGIVQKTCAVCGSVWTDAIDMIPHVETYSTVIKDPSCYEEGVEVTSLPGAAACITALTMSGRPTRRFSFEAFLPKDKKERAAVLEELKNETRTIIIYEAPHHLLKTVKELMDALGDRELTVCRELTKKYEEKIQTTFSSLLSYYEDKEPRGEYVLVICGKSREEIIKEQQESWEQLSIEEHVAHYENQGIARKEAMKMVAKDRGVSKRDIYQYLVK